jgi:hypothetical protein
MRRKILGSVVAGLFAATPAFAQTDADPFRVEGSATIGYLNNNSSAFDRASLDLYQDLSNGVLSNFGLRGRNSRSWFDGYGENFGRDDQFMYIRGGMYGVYKAGAYLNDIPHVFSSNAYTPYSGVGGNTLTASFPLSALPTAALPQAPGTWNQFVWGYDRRDVGGYVEWQRNSPWYFRADGNQVTFDGTKVGSAANGTSPGNGFVDLAFPTQYTTNNWGVEAGYQSLKATFAVRWDYSKFENDNKTLQWTNPFFGGNQLDASYLPPDNEFNKFTISGNYRDLPWSSVISARYTWAKTTSDATLATTALNTGGVFAPTLPQEEKFDGEHVNQSLALSWTARPWTNGETRVFYYWTKLQNKSNVAEYGNAPTQPLPSGLGCATAPGLVPPATVPGNCDGERFDYEKSNVGIDAWWKFARGQRLGAGWDYTDMDQERIDYRDARTNRFWAEYKNTMLDTLSARLKYQYINRDSTSNFSTDGLTANDPAYLNAFTSAFDMQSSTTNQVKLYLDWTPIPTVGVSFEGNWSNMDYDQVTYGRTKVDRQGYFASVNWSATPSLRLNGFASWEEFKYPSNHRYIGTIAGGPTPPSGFCTTANPNCFDPSAPPFQASPGSSTASYNWSSQTKDQTWMVGVGGDWQAMDALAFSASYLYIKNKGNGTFSVQDGIVLNNPPVLPIDNFDNSTQQYFNLKGNWKYNKNWSFTGGYSYMKYNHDDVATTCYPYTLPFPGVNTNTSLSYLNGYDAFTDGHSNLFYVLATYRFDAAR